MTHGVTSEHSKKKRSVYFYALVMKLSPWNVNLAKSEKRHNGLTDVTAKEVLIRFWANERWEISLPREA